MIVFFCLFVFVFVGVVVLFIDEYSEKFALKRIANHTFLSFIWDEPIFRVTR